MNDFPEPYEFVVPANGDLPSRVLRIIALRDVAMNAAEKEEVRWAREQGSVPGRVRLMLADFGLISATMWLPRLIKVNPDRWKQFENQPDLWFEP